MRYKKEFQVLAIILSLIGVLFSIFKIPFANTFLILANLLFYLSIQKVFLKKPIKKGR